MLGGAEAFNQEQGKNHRTATVRGKGEVGVDNGFLGQGEGLEFPLDAYEIVQGGGIDVAVALGTQNFFEALFLGIAKAEGLPPIGSLDPTGGAEFVERPEACQLIDDLRPGTEAVDGIVSGAPGDVLLEFPEMLVARRDKPGGEIDEECAGVAEEAFVTIEVLGPAFGEGLQDKLGVGVAGRVENIPAREQHWLTIDKDFKPAGLGLGDLKFVKLTGRFMVLFFGHFEFMWL